VLEMSELGVSDLGGEVLASLKEKYKVQRSILIEQHLVNIDNKELNNFEKGQIWTFTQLIGQIEQEIENRKEK